MRVYRSVHIDNLESVLRSLGDVEIIQILDGGANYWHIVLRTKDSPKNTKAIDEANPTESGASNAGTLGAPKKRSRKSKESE